MSDWKDDDFLSFDIDSEKITKVKSNSALDDDTCSYNSMASSDMDESMTSDSKSNPLSSLPPWIDDSRNKQYFSRQIHPLTKLHNEIVSFCHLMEPLPYEIEQREKLVNRIRETVREYFDSDTKVEVFGSQATGLFLPTSDIDIVVITKDYEKQNMNDATNEDMSRDNTESSTDSLGPLQRFSMAIQNTWLDELFSFEVIEKTRVPLVKFRHATTNIQVDVSFNQPTGPPAAKLTKEYLQALPPLRPLTFVLKYFLAARCLNEPYSGGVGSFMLQLLIVAFLQHHRRAFVNTSIQTPTFYNLGSLLLDFFKLFGTEFNYLTTGISLQSGGFFFPKGASDRKALFWNQERQRMVALENPQNLSHDIGASSFRFQMVQRAFAVAYKVLLCYTASPVLNEVPSILATILPPTDYMKNRLIRKISDQALSASRDKKRAKQTPPGNAK
jgi:non-canonical poly(A) RNA polymerase PAPD5/7